MHIGLTALLLLGSTAFAVAQHDSADGTLDRVRWLAGCWEMQQGARTTFEMWMPPAGGVMLGASRTVAGDSVVEWERLQLWEKDGNLVYTSLPSGQTEASFMSTRVTEQGFTVENLQHDFPQRIIYRRAGIDSLIARIEGAGASGTRGRDFPMKRSLCEVPQ